MQLKKTYVFAAAFLLSSCAALYGLSEEEYTKRKKLYEEFYKYTDCLTFGEFSDYLSPKKIYYYGSVRTRPAYSFDDLIGAAKIAGRCDYIRSTREYFYGNLKRYLEEKEFKKKQKEEENRRIAKEKEQNRIMKNDEKKYGKKFCSEPVLNVYILRNAAVPSDCMTYSDNLIFEVSQQVQDGTLVNVAYPQYMRHLLITKNKKDSVLVTGQNVPAGIFIGQGNYTYTTIFGATNTVSKLKRLE